MPDDVVLKALWTWLREESTGLDDPSFRQLASRIEAALDEAAQAEAARLPDYSMPLLRMALALERIAQALERR
jgi:hypothetical protein